MAKASMDELAKRWLVDGHGHPDDQIAERTWAVDCLAGGGALDREAEREATEKGLGQFAGTRRGRGDDT